MTAETESMAGIRQRHALVERSADKMATAASMAYLSHLDRGDLLKEIDRLRADIESLKRYTGVYSSGWQSPYARPDVTRGEPQ